MEPLPVCKLKWEIKSINNIDFQPLYNDIEEAERWHQSILATSDCAILGNLCQSRTKPPGIFFIVATMPFVDTITKSIYFQIVFQTFSLKLGHGAMKEHMSII